MTSSGDDAQASPMRLGYEVLEVLARTVLCVNIVVVGDVIPVVLSGRRVEGQQHRSC